MNKLLLIILVAIEAPFVAKAQKIKFSDTTNIWWEQGFSTGSAVGKLYAKYYYSGDTVMNSKQYLKLFNNHGWESVPTAQNPHPVRSRSTTMAGFIREDNTAGIVYLAKISSSVLQEDTLYNYNWQLNDTVTGGEYQRTVIAVDSVIIGGVYHKIWEFQYVVNKWDKYQVVEGIGCLLGLLHTLDMPYFEAGTGLFCFRNNMGNPILNKSLNGFDNAESCTLGIKETERLKTNTLAIIPHPATTGSYMQFPHVFTGTISIYNNIGQLILSEKIDHAEHWALQNKLPAAGVYFYRVCSEVGNEIFAGKLLFE